MYAYGTLQYRCSIFNIRIRTVVLILVCTTITGNILRSARWGGGGENVTNLSCARDCHQDQQHQSQDQDQGQNQNSACRVLTVSRLSQEYCKERHVERYKARDGSCLSGSSLQYRPPPSSLFTVLCPLFSWTPLLQLHSTSPASTHKSTGGRRGGKCLLCVRERDHENQN
jgi:hypothetical protein